MWVCLRYSPQHQLRPPLLLWFNAHAVCDFKHYPLHNGDKVFLPTAAFLSKDFMMSLGLKILNDKKSKSLKFWSAV